jgi:DNA-binding LytR/AlgR family response regulator
MKKLNIAIVDDEKIQLDSMQALIKQAAGEMSLTVQLSIFASGEQFLFELEDYPNLDLVFLDIEMNNIDGLEVAQKIREKDSEMTIVFATAFAEYAVQGYEVQALDYLLKPIEVSQLIKVFHRHLERKPQIKESISLEVNGQLVKLFLEDILYVEVIKRECYIHLKDQTIIVNKTLKELSKELNENFIQTHRSYLVNVAHIEGLLNADVELSNGETIPVSRRLSKEVQEKFIAHNRKSVFYDE